jgi:hypothetical protein
MPGKSPETPAGCDPGTAGPYGMDSLLQRILPLSVRGLQGMFDPERQRFCFRAVRNDGGIRLEGESGRLTAICLRRYTMICLLGLSRWERSGERSPVDVQKALSSLLSSTEEIDSIGDLGLLLWLCAVAAPDRLPRVWSERRAGDALSRLPDALRGETVALSWFLSGISHAALAGVPGVPGLGELAEGTCRALLRNYGGKGIFRHMRGSSLAGLLRGRWGCFADQVYPIYALSGYHRAFGRGNALRVASETAEAICRFQGPLGQWWWHYDAETGRMVGKYPVYSVHQDGMAPMALHALEEVSGRSFRGEIRKGLQWIAGRNELSTDLIDPSRNVIWRNIHRNRYKLYASEMASIFFPQRREKQYADLKVLYECWSYHLGWLLYAFSNATSGWSAGEPE